MARLALLLWAVASIAATAWVLSQNPFVRPLVARSASEARMALDAAVARQVTLDWLIPRLDEALASDDMQRVTLLQNLAQDQRIALPAPLLNRIDAARASHEGWLATLSDCRVCMADVTQCPSLTLVASCTIPFELSPMGDAAALVRQGSALVAGDEVDEIEAGLAGVGLAASAAALVTAGGSLTLKGSATLLRVARRADALSPGMRRALSQAARNPNALQDMAVDVARLAGQTSPAEVLPILRMADHPADLHALARLSDVTRDKTRLTLEALGKARSLRLLSRVSDLALTAAGLMTLLLGQIITFALAGLKLGLRALLR